LTDPAKRAKASLNNTAYAARQIVDIRRLETGQSTENIALLGRLEASQSLIEQVVAGFGQLSQGQEPVSGEDIVDVEVESVQGADIATDSD